MAFSRSFLKSSGLSDEQIAAVIEEHTAVTDALKADRDKYKTEAEKAADLQKQLDDMSSGEDWQKKYNDEHKAFEDFKASKEQEETAAKVRAAYRKLLIDEKISEKRLDSILKVTDISEMKLDKDGNLEGEKELRKAISKEWGDFCTTVTTVGAKVDTPPDTDNNAFESMSLADKMSYANQHPTDAAVMAWLNK